MIPLFNVGGYLGKDPLDNLSTVARYGVSIAIAAGVCTAFLYVIFMLMGIATLQYAWLFWVEVAVLALIYTPIIVTLRKSSSVILMLMLAGIGIPLDLYIENAFRQQGVQGLWMYQADGLLGGMHPLLQIAAVWVGDALVAGPITLWIIRLVASLFAPSADAEPQVDEKAYRELFPDAFVKETVEKPARNFDFIALRLLALVYIGYMLLLVVALLGTEVYPAPLRDFLNMTYLNPALTINTYIKIGLMVVLAMTGAYNTSLRFHSSLVLLVGHLVSTLVSLAMYLAAPQGEHAQYLMMSAIADTGLVMLFGIVMYRNRASAAQHKRTKEYPEYYSLANRLTQLFYYIYGGAVFLIVPGVIAIRFVLDGATGWAAIYGYPDPQLANTVTKYSTLAMLAWLIAQRETLRETLGKAIVLAYSISVIVSGIWLMVGGMFADIHIATRLGTLVTEDWYFMLNVLMDAGVVVLVLGLRKMYYTVEYTINAINPASARSVLGMHDALWGSEGKGRQDALVAIDRHVADMRGRKRGLLNFPFWILEHVLVTISGIRPGFSAMDPQEQRHFLRAYVLRTPDERRAAMMPMLADAIYKIGNAMHALINLAHYTSVGPRTDIGYVPSDARQRLQGNHAQAPPPDVQPAPLPTGPGDAANYQPEVPVGDRSRRPLVAPRVVTAIDDPQLPDEVDYIVVGSGAGAAVMAYRLACETNAHRILVVERGPRYSPLQDFNDDEMGMVRKLYKEGGLQMSRRFDLTVLQGECLGGTTVINNAICLEMPEHVRSFWQNDLDIDLSGLDEAYRKTGEELEIGALASEGINTKVAEVFHKGVQGYNSARTPDHALHTKELKANMRNDVGDGLLNLGNRRMRKLSMLETYLPWAEARGVRIVSNTSAVKIIADGTRATGVLMRSRIGAMKEVKVRKAVVVAGGAISSSHVLMRSELQKHLAGTQPDNVGRFLSCNMAFPVAIEFGHTLDAYDGTQITLGAGDTSNRAVFETYFNPPASFAISLPFYFGRQQHIMDGYRRMVNFGALVGSEANGVVQPQADWLDGRAFTWTLGAKDQANIKYALTTLLELARHAGGKTATLPMEPGIAIPLNADSIATWSKTLQAYPLNMDNLRLTTAHPQGGNRMAGRNSAFAGTRVVDENYRVAGMDNVFVADASIFPTGITVNPQWTILAMSSMASQHVLKVTS